MKNTLTKLNGHLCCNILLDVRVTDGRSIFIDVMPMTIRITIHDGIDCVYVWPIQYTRYLGVV